MKPYHKTVQDGIMHFGHRRGFHRTHRDNIPIHINHPQMRYQIFYRPDAHFETSHGKLIIYEVLDDQLHDKNLVIADIIQAYLSPNVSKIFFIVPRPEDQDPVKELAVTIYARLVSMGIPEQELREVRTLYITRQEARSARKVSDLLFRGRSEA